MYVYLLVRAFITLSLEFLSSGIPRYNILSNLMKKKSKSRYTSSWHINMSPKKFKACLKICLKLYTYTSAQWLLTEKGYVSLMVYHMYFKWKQSVLATYLPGLSNAESSRSGRLVAPITNTSQDLLRPSNSAKSWETTRSMTPPESPDLPRLGAKESNSSKKMTQGVALLALSNTVTRCKYMYKLCDFDCRGKRLWKKFRKVFSPPCYMWYV